MKQTSVCDDVELKEMLYTIVRNVNVYCHMENRKKICQETKNGAVNTIGMPRS